MPSLSMESITAKSEGSLWGAALGPTMRAYLWVTSKNKSLIGTREEDPICINGMSTTLPESFPGSRDEIEDFASFVSDFHPNLNFTWSISDEQLPFLQLVLKPTSDRLATRIHYTGT